MLSPEIADLVENLVVVDSRGWNARNSFGLYHRHFRVIMIVNGPIRMMVVMVVEVMRNGGCCVADRAYWSAILPVLAMMMMAGDIS